MCSPDAESVCRLGSGSGEPGPHNRGAPTSLKMVRRLPNASSRHVSNRTTRCSVRTTGPCSTDALWSTWSRAPGPGLARTGAAGAVGCSSVTLLRCRPRTLSWESPVHCDARSQAGGGLRPGGLLQPAEVLRERPQPDAGDDALRPDGAVQRESARPGSQGAGHAPRMAGVSVGLGHAPRMSRRTPRRTQGCNLACARQPRIVGRDVRRGCRGAGMHGLSWDAAVAWGGVSASFRISPRWDASEVGNAEVFGALFLSCVSTETWCAECVCMCVNRC